MAETSSNCGVNYDIVIAGGGMVGASLALLLAAQSHRWKVLVVEANPQQQASTSFAPSFDARSTALSFSTRRILEKIGLWPQLLPELAAINSIQVSDRGHVASTELHAHEQQLDAFGYVVENRRLGAVLNGALINTDVEFAAPATIDALEMVRDGVRLTLSDRQDAIHTSLLVVADGAQSATREKLGIGCQVDDYGQMGLIANIALNKPHNGIAYERFTDNGPMALLPLLDAGSQHRSALVWTLPPERAGELMVCSEADFLAELHHWFGYRQGQFNGVGERACYPLKLIQANEQVRRNIAVVGNAAHSLHPVAGQGFNLALRDIAALAKTLDIGTKRGESCGDLALLQRYLNSQQKDQLRTVTASDWLPKLFAKTSPSVALARGAGLFAMDMMPGLRSQFARYGMGLE
ncbi:2-octaprenyl-6-methoxyphenyl hydroxylase [Porticoccaceae bacterium LTM1]|nr:2-octaprenyl-6-methoxyphenyl hydroxylase [Porticoccaceae bacterium LTM1]